MAALSLEKSRDFGIYRALGFSRGEVTAITLLEGTALGSVSFLIAAVTGTALAQILIKVVNLGAFHWTIHYRFVWAPYLLAGGTALLAGLLAASQKKMLTPAESLKIARKIYSWRETLLGTRKRET